MRYFLPNSFILLIVLLIVGHSCKNTNINFRSLSDSLNLKCPITLIDDEAKLTKVSCTRYSFALHLTLLKDGLTDVKSLNALNSDYTERLEKDIADDLETGYLPFIKALYSNSPQFRNVVGKIVNVLDNDMRSESTQGFYPLNIIVRDEICTDSIVLTYNEEWSMEENNDLLNKSMPVELFSLAYQDGRSSLNEKVFFMGIPNVTEDNYLEILCYYDAGPYLSLAEVQKQYFNRIVLTEFLSKKIDDCASVKTFFKACTRRNVGIKFLLEGTKDAIDYDLVSLQLIKEWESWGGNDTIIIDSQELNNLL